MLRQTGNQDGLLGQSILMKQWNIRDLTLGGLFTALIGVGAFLKITIPVQPVPMHFTLQFFFVLLAALLLGSKRAYVSVLTYLVIGLCGDPGLCHGRRSGVSFKAYIRLFDRICGGGLCDGTCI